MISSRSFVKHAAVYGLAGLLVQAGGFVLLPLYTHYLTPADYGVLEVLGRKAETVGSPTPQLKAREEGKDVPR